MLNSFQLYNPTTNNLHRNSLNSVNTFTKFRRNSFSSSTSYAECNSNSFSQTKDDNNLSFLNNGNLTHNLTTTTTTNIDDNIFPDTNLSNISTTTTTSSVVSSPSSTIQCVRIIRRNDSAPVQTGTTATTNSIQPRVVRVIRVSNTPRQTEQTTSASSNVYILRKNYPKPTVQINPAVKQVLEKNSMNNNNNNNNNTIDENNQTNKFYGSTISIFGIEFTVVPNEDNPTDKCASLVQNMNDTNTKTNVRTVTNKINDIHKLFSRIYRCVICSAEFDVYEDFVSHGSGHLQDLTLKPLETASVFRRRSYRCLLPHCNARIESETESPRIVDQLFRRHLLSHVGTHPFKCHICKSKFQRIQNYRVHVAFHEEMNSPTLQCKNCLKKFSSEKQYNFHIPKCFVVPQSSPLFRCRICGENFEKDPSLKLHMKHFHPSRPSTPNVETIQNDDEIRVRLASPAEATVKPKISSNSCQICHEEFPKRLLYKKHMLTHLGDKHFACTYPACKDTFYTQSNLDRHVRTVHLRANHPFTCSFPNCGKTFTRNDSLKIHRAKHFPNMIMKCPYVDCEEKFRVRSTYHAHIKRHRNEKQQPSAIYMCSLQNCQYTTSNKASMKQHLTKVHDYRQEKNEDIPYIQYPPKQHLQQQQLHTDKPTTAAVAEVSAPIVVNLPSDEPLQPTTIDITHPQPLVSSLAQPQTDSFDFFNMISIPDIPLDYLDWLNIESEENIRPRKRQNIITISRDMESLSTVVVENLSGCARTDYRSNHAVLERAKFRRKLLNYKRELLRVDSQPISTSTRRLSCQLPDENDNGIEDEDDDILETTMWETSPKRMKRWTDVNEA